MNKTRIFLLFFFIIVINLHSQNLGSIRGVIIDSVNGEVLAHGNILIKEINRGVSSDSKGYFLITSLKFPQTYTLVVSYIGYISKTIEVNLTSANLLHIDVPLSPSSIEIQTVEKIGEKITESNATDISLQRISSKDLETLPSGVETDIFRAMQYMPGVKSTGDVSARYYVRGSPSNQNLILINDVPVYHPFHALGMFSAVDPEMINNIEFYKGGFTSEYSGRLSSIMKLNTKDGNKYRLAGKTSLSLLTGKGLVEGPIPGGSFILTGRKSTDTGILKKFSNGKNVPVDFYDVSAKINFQNNSILKDGKFSLFGFFSNDNLDHKNANKANFKWENNLIGFKWFQLSDSPLFYEINFSYSNFNGEVIPNASFAKGIKNSLEDITFQMDFHYVYDSKNELDVGVKIQEIKSELFVENSSGAAADISGPKGANISIYGKYKILSSDNFGIDFGSRLNLTRIATGSKKQYYFEPRISLTYRFIPQIAFKAAWGIYNQELITLSDEDDLITVFEPWFIVPKYLEPSQAVHYIAGFEVKFSQYIKMNIETYYKEISNFSSLNDEKYFAEDNDIISGNGESYGIEYSLNYSNFPLKINTSYSLSHAFKNIKGFNYRPRYDSRHSLNFSIEYNLGNGWYTSMAWIYYSGVPFTKILGFQDKLSVDNEFTTDYLYSNYVPFTQYGERNSARLPDYHRMDLNVSKIIDLKFVKLFINFSLVNLYDRKNLFYFEKNTGERVNMLPFLPSASIKAEF